MPAPSVRFANTAKAAVGRYALARARDRDAPIEVRAQRRGGGVEIVVSNRGPGMSRETMAGLFARFQRDDLVPLHVPVVGRDSDAGSSRKPKKRARDGR